MSDDIKIEVALNDMDQDKEEYKFKVVVVGDSGAGKTNLIKRFVHNSFSSDTKATIGIEFQSLNVIIKGEVYKIEIWDTAGQERYRSITSSYYKGAKGAIIIYDVTRKATFENVDKWRNEIREKGSKDLCLMMIGNKTDLSDKIQVTSEMAMDKGKVFEIPIMETSALNATNVERAFHNIIIEMYKASNMSSQYQKEKENIIEKGESVKINTIETNKSHNSQKKQCC